MSILIAIFIFSIIILFHELGHFSLAKANGIRVNEFSLGLGPTIVGFTKGETKYSLKLLPFGGACMMEGEDESSDDSRAFGNKSVWARISVVFAGPFFNFIMAFAFAVVLIGCIGFDIPKISGVVEGYAAEEAGLAAGDVITKINGKNIYFYREVSNYTLFHPGEAMEIVYERGGTEYETILTPTYVEEENRYLYGFYSPMQREKTGFFQTIVYAVREVGYNIITTIDSLKLLVSGGVSVNELSGPVGIVSSIGSTYEESVEDSGHYYAFLNMLNWTILLSANLGVMNLLPLPALDGGRLVFLIIEAIRGKAIDQEKEGMIHTVGILLLLALMVVVLFNDIRKVFFM
uniref:RIP metalloprotease RseP n=1 Tax=Agathobacter sp. TaxID=2021311 RepID=UPI004057A6CA